MAFFVQFDKMLSFATIIILLLSLNPYISKFSAAICP